MEKIGDIINKEKNNTEDTENSEKIALLHYLMLKYDKGKNFWYWYKVVKNVDPDILRAIDRNITEMEKAGYPFKNKAAFFTSTLKQLGLLKVNKKVKDKDLEQLRRQKNREQEELETEKLKQEQRKRLAEWLKQNQTAASK